jgi:hypothetical protein
MSTSRLSKRIWSIGFVIIIMIGVIFRTIWLSDIEYKGDERWIFETTQEFNKTGHIPTLGMKSSAGVPNAGMSIWVFLVLSKLFLVSDPLGLARAVQITNIVAILLLLLFIFYCIDRVEREPWFWSLALVSVNPLSVLFHRKIWPPSVFPIFTLTMFLGWWCRTTPWGAFVWGFTGACLGQIQLGGFFFTSAFVIWTLVFERRSVRWIYWLLGSLLGSISLIPWLIAILHSVRSAHRASLDLSFLRHWFNTSLGLDLKYPLGDDYSNFLSKPILAGQPIYLVAALHIVVICIFVLILLHFIRQVAKDRTFFFDYFIGRVSNTTLAISAAFLGYGILLTLFVSHIRLHYLIVVFNLPELWLAWMAWFGSCNRPQSRRVSHLLLAGMCICQALLTMSLLGFIHEKQIIQGDYGTTYRTQQMIEHRKSSWLPKTPFNG